MNIRIRISLNSGAALCLFLLAFFVLTIWAGSSDLPASLYPVAVGALTTGFSGFLYKRHKDKKIGLHSPSQDADEERAS